MSFLKSLESEPSRKYLESRELNSNKAVLIHLAWVSSHFNEIELSRRVLKTLPRAILAPPPRMTANTPSVKPIDWMFTLISCYLNEMYLLTNRVQQYLKQLKRTCRRTHSKKYDKLLEHLLQSTNTIFADIQSVRDQLVHEYRLGKHIDELLGFAWSAKLKEEWAILAHEKKTWAKRIQNNNHIVEGFLDFIAESTLEIALLEAGPLKDGRLRPNWRIPASGQRKRWQ